MRREVASNASGVSGTTYMPPSARQVEFRMCELSTCRVSSFLIQFPDS